MSFGQVVSADAFLCEAQLLTLEKRFKQPYSHVCFDVETTLAELKMDFPGEHELKILEFICYSTYGTVVGDMSGLAKVDFL